MDPENQIRCHPSHHIQWYRCSGLQHSRKFESGLGSRITGLNNNRWSDGPAALPNAKHARGARAYRSRLAWRKFPRLSHTDLERELAVWVAGWLREGENGGRGAETGAEIRELISDGGESNSAHIISLGPLVVRRPARCSKLSIQFCFPRRSKDTVYSMILPQNACSSVVMAPVKNVSRYAIIPRLMSTNLQVVELRSSSDATAFR